LGILLRENKEHIYIIIKVVKDYFLLHFEEFILLSW